MLLLVAPLAGCPKTADDAREGTSVEWTRDAYDASEGEPFVASFVLSSPFDSGGQATYVSPRDVSILQVLTGTPVIDDEANMNAIESWSFGSDEGEQQVTLNCIGAGTTAVEVRHVADDGLGIASGQVDDTAMVTCRESGASGTTGETETTSTSDPTTTTTSTTGTTDPDETDGGTGGSESSSETGSTGGGGGCAVGESNAPNSDEITVTGLDITGAISGNAGDCPQTLCSFTVTNNTDRYITFGILESGPDDEITSFPIVSAVEGGTSQEFEVFANDCETPIRLERTLFIHDEGNGVSLGELDLVWETFLE